MVTTKPQSKRQQTTADKPAVFVTSEPARIGPEYTSLPKHSAQRHEFEKTWPSDWKHRLLPHQIKELRQRIEAMQSELDKLLPEHEQAAARFRRVWYSNASKKQKSTAQEAYAPIGGKVLGLKADIRRLTGLLQAYEQRWQEGEEVGMDRTP